MISAITLTHTTAESNPEKMLGTQIRSPCMNESRSNSLFIFHRYLRDWISGGYPKSPNSSRDPVQNKHKYFFKELSI